MCAVALYVLLRRQGRKKVGVSNSPLKSDLPSSHTKPVSVNGFLVENPLSKSHQGAGASENDRSHDEKPSKKDIQAVNEGDGFTMLNPLLEKKQLKPSAVVEQTHSFRQKGLNLQRHKPGVPKTLLSSLAPPTPLERGKIGVFSLENPLLAEDVDQVIDVKEPISEAPLTAETPVELNLQSPLSSETVTVEEGGEGGAQVVEGIPDPRTSLGSQNVLPPPSTTDAQNSLPPPNAYLRRWSSKKSAPYFVNPSTKQSVWTLPKGAILLADP